MIVFYLNYNQPVMSQLAFNKHMLDLSINGSSCLRDIFTGSKRHSETQISSFRNVREHLDEQIISGDDYVVCVNFRALPVVSRHDFAAMSGWYASQLIDDYDLQFSFKLKATLLIELLEQSDDYKGVFEKISTLLGKKNELEAIDVTRPKNEVSFIAQAHKPRAFNSIGFNEHTVEKRSSDIRKLKAELNWFFLAQKRLPLKVPRIVKGFEDGYEIERINGFPLSQIYFSGVRDFTFWRDQMTDIILQIHCGVEAVSDISSQQVNNSIILKNVDRLEAYPKHLSKYIDSTIQLNGLEYNFQDVFNYTNKIISQTKPVLGFVHGDPCLSNIMFDPLAERWYFIDPRGYFFHDHDTFFDIHYDLAKLHHSMFGRYEAITAGKYEIYQRASTFELFIHENIYMTELEQVFDKMVSDLGYNSSRIRALSRSFFFSMIPLHFECEQKQLAFYLNGLEISF